MNALQHGRALVRQVLFDAGAEAEMRAVGIEQDGAEAGVLEMLGSAVAARAIIAASIRFAFGRLKRRRSRRPSASNQTLSGEVMTFRPAAGCCR